MGTDKDKISMFRFIKYKIKKSAARILKFLINNSSEDVLFDIYKKMNTNYVNITYNTYREKYEISESFRFNGSDILFYDEGRIICGENSYIGSLSTIQSGDGCKVSIGKNVQISHNVRIYTTSNIADQDFSKTAKDKYHKSVIIEDYVWIGANVFINPGITIGANSIVGANAVLTKDVPSYSIVGGVPARIIKNKTISIKT